MNTTQPELQALDIDERSELFEELLAVRPELEGRLGDHVEVRLLAQAFFGRHRVLWLSDGDFRLHVAVGEDGDVTVLTGAVENFNALATIDPPGLILDDATAHIYAAQCDAWVARREPGERPINAFDDLPLRPELSANERSVVDAIARRVGEHINEGRAVPADDNRFTYDRWFVSDRQLIRRRLTLDSNGSAAFQRDILAGALPLA